jgi:hypothetical protein
MSDLIYNVTKELQSEGSESSFMDVGIHENVKMTNVEYGITDKGNEFLAFYFVNETGEQLSHTEWKPSANLEAQKLESAVINQMKRIKQIVTKFVPESEFVFVARSFKEFAESVVRVLGKRYEGKRVRIKVVYSGKYTSLPSYTKFQFIESMDIPKEKSKIKILSLDKMSREVKPDVETPTIDPISVLTSDLKSPSNTGTTENLPF